MLPLSGSRPETGTDAGASADKSWPVLLVREASGANGDIRFMPNGIRYPQVGNAVMAAGKPGWDGNRNGCGG